MSWEEFYTNYLADITRNTVYQYGKQKLRAAYKKEEVGIEIAYDFWAEERIEFVKVLLDAFFGKGYNTSTICVFPCPSARYGEK